MDLSHLGAYLLMAVFALGVLGCAITVPLCALKFFRVLVEKHSPDEESAVEAPLPTPPVAAAPVKPTAPQPAAPPVGQPSPPVRPANPDAAIPVGAERPAHPRQRRIVPKRNRRPRGTAGR